MSSFRRRLFDSDTEPESTQQSHTSGKQTKELQHLHNESRQNSGNNTARGRKPTTVEHIFDISRQNTGKIVSEGIRDDDGAAADSDDSSGNREAPQPKNCGREMIAYFEALVAEAVAEEYGSHSSANGKTEKHTLDDDDLDENEEPNRNDTSQKRASLLKYTSKDARKKLRSHPNSNILNLPDCSGDNPRPMAPVEDSQQYEAESATEDLYERVREVLKKPTQQKVNQLANEVEALNIRSQEQLQGVVDLAFEKAIDEPKFMAICALMCKEFAGIQVPCRGEEDGVVDFRSLIVRRCVMEFEDAIDENERAILKRDIGVLENAELTKEERRLRTRSFSNIRFMGELFKQGMFTSFIMHKCIQHLLTQIEDESLECLCMLLITIGKDLESKGRSLDEYFEEMRNIVDLKTPGKVSLRVRYKLQYLIKLRSNKWIPSIDDCKTKTINGTKKRSATKTNLIISTVTKVNIAPMLVPKKEDPNGDRKRKSDGKPIEKCGLSTLVKGQRQVSANGTEVVTQNKLAKSKNISSKQAVSMVPLSGSFDVHLAHRTAVIIEEYLFDTRDTSISNTALKVRATYDDTTFANFVREVLSGVIKKSVIARKRVSQLMTHLISEKILPLPLYLTGLGEVLDNAEDLVIYIPEIWVYLAELIWYPLAEGVLPFRQLKTTMGSLKSKGLARDLMVELTIVLVQEKNPKWVKDKWDESGLRWRDFLPESESTDFADQFELDFLVVVSHNTGFTCPKNQLSMEDIQEHLIRLLSDVQNKSLIDIINWISAYVGERIIESEFVKVLMTAILEVSIEPYDKTWQFRVDKFRNVQALIPRYIDVGMKLLELQFLISIQEYIHQIDYPQSLHLQTIEKQTIESIVSFNVFDLLKNKNDLRPLNRRSLAILALKSYFTSFKDKTD